MAGGALAETPAPQERGVEDLIAEHLLATLQIITEGELVGRRELSGIILWCTP